MSVIKFPHVIVFGKKFYGADARMFRKMLVPFEARNTLAEGRVSTADAHAMLVMRIRMGSANHS
jgi:hypothetical protein